MSTERYLHIICDQCRLMDCVTYLGVLSARELRGIMRERGWVRRRERGRAVDVCPYCAGTAPPAPQRTLEDAMHEEILSAVRR